MSAAPVMPSPPSADLKTVRLSAVAPSKTNPRKHFDKAQLAELTDSIGRQGVLQPLLVRPYPTPTPSSPTYELVAGERRWRAAKAAGLEEIPVVVRAMSDAEALESQVIENLQRADLHPLEEAEGYEQLLSQITKAGKPLSAAPLTVEQLADKVGKSTSYIYQRMRLLALVPEARKAYYEEKLGLSVALAIARIPNDKVQAEALDRVLVGVPSRPGKVYPMSAAQAIALLRDDYMLALSSAPWKKDDAELVPAAGACSTCPKRTGAQPALFDDVKNADSCTDPQCFREKKIAFGKRQLEAARAQGLKVVEGKEAKKLVPYEHGVASGYDELDQTCWHDPKRRTHRQLLKAAGDAAPRPIVVEDPHEPGKIREVIAEQDVPALLKAAGVKAPPASTTGRYVRSAADKALEAKRKLEALVSRTIVAAIHQSTAKATREDLELVAACFFADVWHERRRVVMGLWGWEKAYSSSYGNSRDFAARRLKDLSDVELGRFLIDVAVSGAGFNGISNKTLEAAAKRAGVDAAKIRRDLVRSAAEKKAGKDKKGKKAKAKPAPTKKAGKDKKGKKAKAKPAPTKKAGKAKRR